jgi:hypothetical protein
MIMIILTIIIITAHAPTTNMIITTHMMRKRRRGDTRMRPNLPSSAAPGAGDAAFPPSSQSDSGLVQAPSWC